MLKSPDSVYPPPISQSAFPDCSLTLREPTPPLPEVRHTARSSEYLTSTPELKQTNKTRFLVLHSEACLSQRLVSEAEVKSELQGGASELPGYRLLLSAYLVYLAELLHPTAPRKAVSLVPFQLAKRNDLVLMKISGLKLSHKSQGAGGLV